VKKLQAFIVMVFATASLLCVILFYNQRNSLLTYKLIDSDIYGNYELRTVLGDNGYPISVVLAWEVVQGTEADEKSNFFTIRLYSYEANDIELQNRFVLFTSEGNKIELSHVKKLRSDLNGSAEYLYTYELSKDIFLNSKYIQICNAEKISLQNMLISKYDLKKIINSIRNSSDKRMKGVYYCEVNL
jgi:hypothetical protein